MIFSSLSKCMLSYSLKLVVMKIGLHVPYTVFWTLYAGIYNHYRPRRVKSHTILGRLDS